MKREHLLHVILFVCFAFFDVPRKKHCEVYTIQYNCDWTSKRIKNFYSCSDKSKWQAENTREHHCRLADRRKYRKKDTGRWKTCCVSVCFAVYLWEKNANIIFKVFFVVTTNDDVVTCCNPFSYTNSVLFYAHGQNVNDGEWDDVNYYELMHFFLLILSQMILNFERAVLNALFISLSLRSSSNEFERGRNFPKAVLLCASTYLGLCP